VILAIDSTDRGGSIALTDEGTVVALRHEHSRRTHSERLMPIIEQLLEEQELDYQSLDGLAVATGPGSFTAIRLGVTTAKTLAEVSDLPLVAVSSLRLLAEYGRSHPGLIRSVIDARRGELYVQDFVDNGTLESAGVPSLVEPDTFLEDCATMDNLMVVPRGRSWSPEEQDWPDSVRLFPDALARPLALPLARVAHRRFEAGDADDRRRVTPNYVRDSDAKRTSQQEATP
jgi:tRNA threonylcarbamoyladenosine biosynthesis protein TsaB